MTTLGIVLFAVGILVSVMLHEAGHMVTAKHYGMKVTQYFVGFGKTLWSFRKGETEYGVKAIPAGGFVKIIGMTPQEEVAPEDQPRAMWRQSLGRRTVVLSAGSVTHFILGALLLYVCALFSGLPNPAYAAYDYNAQPATIGAVQPCVHDYVANQPPGDCTAKDAKGPAAVAGMRAGDTIVAIDGKPVDSWGQMRTVTASIDPGPTSVVVERAGKRVPLTVDLVAVQRDVGTADKADIRKVATFGISPADPGLEPTVTYGPVAAVGPSLRYAGQIVTGSFTALGALPSKVAGLVGAVEGKPRDPNGPISVVGASRVGGDALAQGGPEGITLFLLLLASLNIFIGIFNLLPLLPLDGGHIAVAWFEAARSRWARLRGRADPGRVDYNKLMPVTFAVIIVFGLFSLLAITADIVNPIRIFQ